MKEVLIIKTLSFILLLSWTPLMAVSGTFEAHSVLSFKRDPISLGDYSYINFLAEGTSSIYISDHDLFKIGAQNSLKKVLIAARKFKQKDTEVWAAGKYENNKGDQIFFEFTDTTLINKPDAKGVLKFTGGTGVYEGIKGSCNFTRKFFGQKMSFTEQCKWTK